MLKQPLTLYVSDFAKQIINDLTIHILHTSGDSPQPDINSMPNSASLEIFWKQSCCGNNRLVDVIILNNLPQYCNYIIFQYILQMYSFEFQLSDIGLCDWLYGSQGWTVSKEKLHWKLRDPVITLTKLVIPWLPFCPSWTPPPWSGNVIESPRRGQCSARR